MITKQALGSTLFGMADILRDKVEDYKAYILSLLFFKRLSDNYEWETENGIKEFIKENGREPSEAEKRIIISKKHDFKIPEGCFWKDVRDTSPDKKNEKLNKAVNDIADANVDRDGKAVLKGVINTVRWNEPVPDGSGSKKLSPDVLSLLVSYLDAVDLSNKNASVDVLGDAYEYLIKRFADENKGGTMAGQFYTPQEIVDVIVRYLKPQKNTTVYDPTCGSGGFLINAAKYCKAEYNNSKAIRLFGQEDVWNTWAIANINMILHGLDARIEKGDTILDPKFTEEDNELSIRQFDLAMANFPFSQENWWKNGKPKKDRKGKVDHNGEFTEMHNIIDAIVVLPGNLFYGTTIPGAILFINKDKPEERKDKVLMVYAAKEGWYKEEANMNVLLPHDILRISTILESWGDLEKAKTWITSKKGRLKDKIQEDLDFKLLEIEEYYAEDIELAEAKLTKAKKVIADKEADNQKPTKTQLKAVVTAQNALDKLINEKEAKITAAHDQAQKERQAIDDVEQELITMLQDPEQRKRYFAIADMEELEENEFNLNIPRYVDTFEPEEEIDLKEAIAEFKTAIGKESDLDNSIDELLKVLL